MTRQNSEPACPGRLLRDGIPVAVVGYIGGDYLRDDPTTRTPGAGRVVNIRGDGYLLTGKNLFSNGTEFAVLYAALAAEDGSEAIGVTFRPLRRGKAANGFGWPPFFRTANRGVWG